MDKASLMPEAPGRFVPGQIRGESYHAFVPDALPPVLRFEPGWVARLSQADQAVGELRGLSSNLENPYLLVSPFLRREAVLSSRIEGTQTTLEELLEVEAGQLVLPGLESARRSDDAREVLNYVHALERARGEGIASARFVPPPPQEVLPLMDSLERYIQDPSDQWPALARLAWIHY